MEYPKFTKFLAFCQNHVLFSVFFCSVEKIFCRGLKWEWANFIKVSETPHPLTASYLEASCWPTEFTQAVLQVHGLVHNASKIGRWGWGWVIW